MGNEANEKHEQQQRPTERQTDYEKRAQGEVNANVKDYTEHVTARRLEKKLSGNSGVTGQLPDKNGKGLASAKDLLGDDAHGLSKKEKQSALLAQVEKDGYIVGKAQDKPILIAEKTAEKTETNPKIEPIDGKTVKLYDVLANYKTPFTEAFEKSDSMKPGTSGKLSMLEETVKRLQTVPWKEKLDVHFDSKAQNPEYNPVGSVITINTKHGKERQIEEFVHEGYHATHQSIGALYINKPHPVSKEDYFNERAKGEVNSFLAEIKVNAELKNPKPIEFEHVVNGKAVNENLTALYAKQGEEGLRRFLLDARPPLKANGHAQLDVFQNLQTMESYREHYEKSYPQYRDTFEQAKPQAGAVLKEYQKKNPGKTSADFIREGY